MNYGIGNVLVNPYLFNMMGPYGYTSTWGDSIQFNTMPDYFTQTQASLTHGILNPNHVSQWNPMFSIPAGTNVTNTAYVQQGILAAENLGAEMFYNSLASIKIQSVTTKIATLKTQAETLLDDENLNDSQKAKIQKIVDDAKALEEKLTEIAEKANNPRTSRKTVCDDLTKLENNINEVKKSALETIKAIKKELETGNVEDTEEAEETPAETPEETPAEEPEETTTPTPAQTEETPETQPAQPEQPAQSTQNEVQSYTQNNYTTSEKAKEAGKIIADAIYEAVDHTWGTDEEKLKSAMISINGNNVMETLDAWNKSKAGEFGGESMLESIYDDIFWGDERKEYTMIILDALAEKAKNAKVDISAEYDAVVKELDCWWRDDSKIFKLINEIHKNLGGKEYKEF